MIEIYLKSIYRLMFHILCNNGGRKAALQIDADLERELKDYDARQSELKNTDSRGSSGAERNSGRPTVRGSVGAGTEQNASGGWNPGI